VSTRLEVPAFTASGERRARAVRLPAEPFDGRVHPVAMHQAVKVFLANRRQGTAQTKTRRWVTGGNQKPWRQKGTGRARQGSIRSPLWPGGGTVFGPVPRDYRLGLPRRLRRLALHSALNTRARERALAVIEALKFQEPKTKRMAALLDRLGVGDRRVLVLTGETSPNVVLSARNLPNVEVKRWSDASTYDVLRADYLLVEEPALGGELEQGGELAAEAAAPPARLKRAPTQEKPEEVVAPAAVQPRKATKKAVAPPAEAPARKEAAPKKAATRPATKAPAKKPAAKKPAAKPQQKKKK
jgi:large subunit ribosomal protein L4